MKWTAPPENDNERQDAARKVKFKMLSLIVDVHTVSRTDSLMESKGDLRRRLFTTSLMIMLAATFAFTLLFPLAKAPNVAITFVFPTSHHGKVGEKVNIIGTTNKTGGSYRVWLGNRTVVSDTSAVGTTANATFLVPSMPGQNYTLILQDVTENINATSWFVIDPSYRIEARDGGNKTIALPRQLQENDPATIWLNMTGAKASTAYVANVTVKTPSPDNKTFWKQASFSTTADGEFFGFAAAYPGSFQGGPHTNYTGTYSIALNSSATNTFKVGLTNSTEYHRGQYVDIKAAHYKLDENVNVKVRFGTDVKHNVNVSVLSDGLVRANWTLPNWTMPSPGSIGTYTINVTSLSSTNATVKSPRDVQDFTVPGFTINMTAKNLAGDHVSNVAVKVFENGKSAANATSGSNGLVLGSNGLVPKLEIGIYTCNATYKGKKVAEQTINVTGAASLNLNCSLTNLKILVITEANVLVPEVKIYLKPENFTLTTNATGVAVARSLLPNASLTSTSRPYVLNASRYNVSFNVTTFQTLFVNSTAVKFFNVTILCPTLTLRVNAVNAESQPIAGATVKVQELIGGLYNEAITGSSGNVAFSFIFGKYVVGVYDADGIKVNETTVDLFQNQNASIVCRLYGLALSIKVVDYFGQPIPNVHVILEREGMTARPSETQTDGTATFNTVTGGTFSVTLYMTDPDQPWLEEGFLVDTSKTVQIKLDKYVMLAGSLVETNQFVTVLIIVLTLVCVAAIEVYRRRRLRPQKTED